ncbi:hypothetical protein E3C22_00685 [Jiella endophytica]|uniref:Uncharacterized protein n=1 Tax=Jiella endophytica TaxID=2558362 RepID=A0A4Y8RGZ3_9HYPH|nr:hypothetical protein [Jiella endophytica]TFF20730.1 hypothetical protein E3C22_17725 [Jiella endophytica]TFF27031.1 hypothetical protein E3C22_00685 [Jiella endophytica]
MEFVEERVRTAKAYAEAFGGVSRVFANKAAVHALNERIKANWFQSALREKRSKLKLGDGILIVVSFHQRETFVGTVIKDAWPDVGPIASNPALAIHWYRQSPKLYAAPSGGFRREESYHWDRGGSAGQSIDDFPQLIGAEPRADRCYMPQHP